MQRAITIHRWPPRGNDGNFVAISRPIASSSTALSQSAASAAHDPRLKCPFGMRLTIACHSSLAGSESWSGGAGRSGG